MSILFYNDINDKWLKKYKLYQIIGTKLCMNMNTYIIYDYTAAIMPVGTNNTLMTII